MNMHDSLPDTKTSIVIIGGGIGGSTIIRSLSNILDPKYHSLTLITSRRNYVYLPASLRALVNPDTPLSTVFMPYDNVFGKFPGKIIYGTVTSVEENKRSITPDFGLTGQYNGIIVYQTEGNQGLEQIHYDILVVATGSRWEGLTGFPSELVDCMAHTENWRAMFRKANDIIIAGGGAVGLETAGELKDLYPEKNITIVHADKLPLNNIYPERFRMLVVSRLKERGIEFVFNDAIIGSPTISESSFLTTRNGLLIKCDLLVPARGGRPNTKLLGFLVPSPLSDRGFVKVDSTLQIQHHPNIFAIGDIVDWPENRQLCKIQMGHAGVVVANVVSLLQGIEAKKKYKGTTELILVANGKNSGITYLGILGGIIFGDWFTRWMKSKDLGVNSARKGLGLDPLV